MSDTCSLDPPTALEIVTALFVDRSETLIAPQNRAREPYISRAGGSQMAEALCGLAVGSAGRGSVLCTCARQWVGGHRTDIGAAAVLLGRIVIDFALSSRVGSGRGEGGGAWVLIC